MNRPLSVTSVIDAPGLLLAHEREVDPNAMFIPLVVRMKLDLSGTRISLSDWQALPRDRRMSLIRAASKKETALFNSALTYMLRDAGSNIRSARKVEPAIAAQWLDTSEPESVQRFRKLARVETDWGSLSYFVRFVLCYAMKKGDVEFCRKAIQDLSRPAVR